MVMDDGWDRIGRYGMVYESTTGNCIWRSGLGISIVTWGFTHGEFACVFWQEGNLCRLVGL